MRTSHITRDLEVVLEGGEKRREGPVQREWQTVKRIAHQATDLDHPEPLQATAGKQKQ
jgi:hypothetical protein